MQGVSFSLRRDWYHLVTPFWFARQCSARLGHGAALSALRRSACLAAHSALPPAPAPSPPQPARNCTATEAERDHPSLSLGLRQCLLANLSIRSSTFKTRSPLLVRPAPPLTRRAAPRRSAPLRTGSVLVFFFLTFPIGDPFLLWMLDELLESCEQVREESWGSRSASSRSPENTSLGQSCGR